MFKMKKILFVVLSASVLFACQAKEEKKETDVSQETKAKAEILLGQVQVSDFEAAPYADWYNKEFESYGIDSAAMSELSLDDYTILVVFGTWCGDSRREVPRFIKLMKYANFADYELCAVDRSKICEGKNADELNIEKVPTFIFYKDGAEVGRIIESPTSSLEMDMYTIVSGE